MDQHGEADRRAKDEKRREMARRNRFIEVPSTTCDELGRAAGKANDCPQVRLSTKGCQALAHRGRREKDGAYAEAAVDKQRPPANAKWAQLATALQSRPRM